MFPLKSRDHLMAVYVHLAFFIGFLLQTVLSACPANETHWSGWWGYDGYSEGHVFLLETYDDETTEYCDPITVLYTDGPRQWGDHSDWELCKLGKNQSPINIEPGTLLFDPHLKNLYIELTKVNGILKNAKRDITFILNPGEPSINITAGPLSYRYRLHQIKLHFGRNDLGSEHTIDGQSFPAEFHFMAYNAELYPSYRVAVDSPRGVAIVAVFVTVGDNINSAFEIFREKFVSIEQEGNCTEIRGLPVEDLLPKTDSFVTYSGSLTQPGCRETVTWIIYNRPIYISHRQMRDLQDIPYQEWRTSNTRPVMPLNSRTVRTNINVRKRTRLCTMEIDKLYQVNPQIGHGQS